MKNKFKRTYFAFLGIITGIANGLFGSGGGMLAVPMLEKAELEPKEAHSTAIAITLPLSIASGFIYFRGGSINILQALKFVPLGLLGAYIGAKLLKKLANIVVKRTFAIVMIIAGLRLIIK
ncbi:MAG: sulfite exporter TauE/SafE family protein [Clostridiales bacterium]|nr:sulfite exporter TauE/SafE family protein [Clostridiales bacterium]